MKKCKKLLKWWLETHTFYIYIFQSIPNYCKKSLLFISLIFFICHFAFLLSLGVYKNVTWSSFYRISTTKSRQSMCECTPTTRIIGMVLNIIGYDINLLMLRFIFRNAKLCFKTTWLTENFHESLILYHNRKKYLSNVNRIFSHQHEI